MAEPYGSRNPKHYLNPQTDLMLRLSIPRATSILVLVLEVNFNKGDFVQCQSNAA
jgi:hypothetical protein